jgi:hypothetical protein
MSRIPFSSFPHPQSSSQIVAFHNNKHMFLIISVTVIFVNVECFILIITITKFSYLVVAQMRSSLMRQFALAHAHLICVGEESF